MHLSATAEEALSVGGRHTDEPILIEIDTRRAREAGVRFSQASEVIWLSDEIPLDAIRLPDLPELPEAPPPRPAAPRRLAGTAPRCAPVPQLPAEPPDDGEFRRRTRKKATRR